MPSAPQAPQGNAFGMPGPFSAPQAPQGNAFGAQQGVQGVPWAQAATPWGASPQGGPPYSPPLGATPTSAKTSVGKTILGVMGAGLIVALGVCVKVGVRAALRRGGQAVHTGSSRPSATSSTGLPGLPASTTPRAPRVLPPDEQIQAKLDPYVDHCLNRFSRQVFDAEGRYLQWVDRARGPTGRERIVHGIYTVHGETSECATAVTRAAAMQPSMPAIESAATRFSTALHTVVPLIRQAHAYYSNRLTYQGDGMAQGRLLHPRLIAAFDDFTAAHQAFSDELLHQQDLATEAFLARARNDPDLVVEYHLKNDQLMARRIIRLTRNWRIARNGQLLGIDGNALAPQVTQYAQGLDALQRATLANPQQASRIVGLPNYQANCRVYLAQLQRLVARLQHNERFNDSELRMVAMRLGHTVPGSPEAVSHAYNNAVNAYNRLR